MGRDPTIEYCGAIYLVIQWGNSREYIFREDVDKGIDCQVKLITFSGYF